MATFDSSGSECTIQHQSASPLAYGTPRPGRQCGIGRTGTHHWRYSVSIVSSPTHGSVTCAPKWAWDIWLDAATNIRRPEAVSEWFELTSACQIGGSSAFADEEPRWSDTFWPFGAVDRLPVAWRFSSNLHASSDVVGQSLSCIAKFCLCILETPPASWLLLAENWHLPTTWQFTAVYTVANFVAWSPLKVQRSINSLYRSPILHKIIKVVMARQTSLQVTTPELTFFLLLSLSGPQTILTVFGHSIWLRNGSMKSTVFRSAIDHTTRNNKYQSNSCKCHLVVVIP